MVISRIWKHAALAVLALAALNAAQATAPDTATGNDGERFVVEKAAARNSDAQGIEAFAAQFDEALEAVLVELSAAPGFMALPLDKRQSADFKQAIAAHARSLQKGQDEFIATAKQQSVPLLLRVKPAQAQAGLLQPVRYSFSYLMNGFIAYVPRSRLPILQALPGVRSVSVPIRPRLMVDNAVDYMLGRAPTLAARRLAVYGASEELSLIGGAPAATPLDGREGQGMALGVIDSGLDYEHPMLGGSGVGTPLPQRPPLAATPSDNKKVIYWYNLGGAATLDDNGHGTHVSSTAGGVLVDGSTSAVPMSGAALPVGPTPGGARLHGVAPQARVLGWPVCAASGNCAGDVELALEDAVSPVILSGQGDGGSVATGIAKPVADVVNLSLGGGTDPAAPSSRSANNAFLAGLVVVAAAGNDGPSASTAGAPCVSTLSICVASVLDPGSTAGSDVLAAGEIVGDDCADTNGACVLSAPTPESAAASQANARAPGERAGLRTFHMDGGGDLPGGSVSAHYVFVDRDQASVPASVAGRIALLENGTGTFAQIVNPVAALGPAAILLITDTSSATAVAVINGIPTYTLPAADGSYLKTLMLSAGGAPPHGSISRLPLRVNAAIALTEFRSLVSEFSSRGPNSHDNGAYRTIKPDLAAPGQGVLAAVTPSGNLAGAAGGSADPSGYKVLSGTSMATPHVSGAATLVRQRVRELGYDSTDPGAPDYLARRYRASVLTRALLTNYATDLRTGVGAEDPDGPNPPYTIQDVGAGLVDVAAALAGHAVMTSPTKLYDTAPDEFTAPGFAGALPVAPDAEGNVLVRLPTASFGNVEVLGVAGTLVSLRSVTVEDIDGQGAGNYLLSKVDDVLSNHGSVSIAFYDAAGVAPISSVVVPANGSATFNVRVAVVGDGGLANGAVLTWYVHATQQSTGQRLRMPFLYRAVRRPTATLGVPEDLTIAESNPPAQTGACYVDPNNAYRPSWNYQAPEGAPPLVGFRVERASYNTEVFHDDTSEPLAAGANSLWSGSAQWVSNVNPSTSDSAYFIPNAANQNEALALLAGVPIPAGARANVDFLTNVNTEEGFDFAVFEANGNDGSFQELGRLSGLFDGKLGFDLSAYAGQSAKLRLRMTSDLAVPAPGWYVDDVSVRISDFATRAQVDASIEDFLDRATVAGTYHYRVAGLFDADGLTVLGPYSGSQCVCVSSAAVQGNPDPDLLFRNGFDTEAAVNCP